MRPLLPACLLWLPVAAAFPADAGEGDAPSIRSIDVVVSETAGIRRFGYPVSSRVPIPRGSLRDAGETRLLRGGAEIPAQLGVESRWEDGSVQWLTADWSADQGALSREIYTLQHGPGAKAARKPGGLTVAETEAAFQIGPMRFRKDGRPLLESCQYTGAEIIGDGPNGLFVLDAEGREHDLRGAEMRCELVKPGPVHVLLRYSGRWARGGEDPIQFTTDVEMVHSKSWWKVTHAVRDPAGKLRAIALRTPWRLGALPAVWDFGTGSWTYGAIRQPAEVARLDQRVDRVDGGGGGGGRWSVFLGKAEDPPLYETGAPPRPSLAEGWGHVTGKDGIAFAIEEFGRLQGLYRIEVSGAGRAEFSYLPPEPAGALRLAVYQHFVSSPVQIGAATSPPSMLRPLWAACRKAHYTACGLQAPEDAPD